MRKRTTRMNNHMYKNNSIILLKFPFWREKGNVLNTRNVEMSEKTKVKYWQLQILPTSQWALLCNAIFWFSKNPIPMTLNLNIRNKIILGNPQLERVISIKILLRNLVTLSFPCRGPRLEVYELDKPGTTLHVKWSELQANKVKQTPEKCFRGIPKAWEILQSAFY